MPAADRLKKVRDLLGKSQKEMAALLGINYRTYENYEKSLNPPSWETCTALVKLGFNANWILTGEGEMKQVPVAQIATGNGFLQGHNIDADEIHIDIHTAGHAAEAQGPVFADPLDNLFLKDWKRLSKAGRLRMWALLEEEIEREQIKKGGGI